jgi:hypothetical protein
MSNELKGRLTKIYEQGLTGPAHQIYQSVARLETQFGVDVVQQLMPSVDPERRVFVYPLNGTERGPYGYPLAHNDYEFFSWVFTRAVKTDPRMPDGFHAACVAGFDSGDLTGCGFVVMDKKTQQFGFLLTHALSVGCMPLDIDISDLSAQLGREVQCLAWLKAPIMSYQAQEEHVALTVFLDNLATTQNYDFIDEIIANMRELESQWTSWHLQSTVKV